LAIYGLTEEAVEFFQVFALVDGVVGFAEAVVVVGVMVKV